MRRKKIIVGIAGAALLVGAYAVLSRSGALATILDGAALKEFINRLGMFGPPAIIGLMAVAIVLNPILRCLDSLFSLNKTFGVGLLGSSKFNQRFNIMLVRGP